MADTLTVQSPDAITRAWLLTPAEERDPTDDLVDAVVIALGSDRLARPDDPLPGLNDTDRRGWWGDLEAAEIWGAAPIGARFHLLARGKITSAGARDGSALVRAETYGLEALRPFREQKIASRITVRAERDGLDGIDVTAILYRGPLPAIALNYQALWGSVRS